MAAVGKGISEGSKICAHPWRRQHDVLRTRFSYDFHMIFSVISQSADIGLALGDDFYSALQYSAASRGFRILAKHMGIDTG